MKEMERTAAFLAVLVTISCAGCGLGPPDPPEEVHDSGAAAAGWSPHPSTSAATGGGIGAPGERISLGGDGSSVLLATDDVELHRPLVLLDLDGDSFDDLVGGASIFSADGSAIRSGLFVHHGSALPLEDSALDSNRMFVDDWRTRRHPVSATVEDVDGDTTADLLVTAGPLDPDCESRFGIAFAAVPRLSGETPLDSVLRTRLEPGVCSSEGILTGLGDLDGDGAGDYVATWWTTNPVDNESAVFYGEPSTRPSLLSSESIAATARSHWMRELGDVNGDGYGEMLMFETAPEPRAHIIVGAKERLAGRIDPATLGRAIPMGLSSNYQLGLTRALGDLDGDGLDDLALVSQEEGGAYLVHLHYGRPLTIGSSFDAGRADAILRVEPSSGLSTLELAAVGDMTGDGLPEVAFALDAYDDNYGVVHVVRGARDRLAGEVDLPRAAVNYLGQLGDSAGTLMTGGDLNGDGLSDLVIAALAHRSPERQHRLYVVHGMPD